MSIGSGGKPITEYRSFVLYHTNSPHWNERIKVVTNISTWKNTGKNFKSNSHTGVTEGKGGGVYTSTLIKIHFFNKVKLLLIELTLLFG